MSAGRFALGAGAQFYARAIDTDKVGLGSVLKAASAFDGASMTEIFQNCIVYNNEVFADFTRRDSAADSQLRLEHGEPMLFGENGEKGIRLNPDSLELEVIDAAANPELVMRHDETNRVKAQMLVELESPVALGVIYRNPGMQTFEQSWHGNGAGALQRSRSVKGLLRGSNSWTVGED